ncbi:hypothetical protein PTSG_07377 [Salpingoeca rosetta]|uniref:Uncharacterized protein n=1 Tax=Salpingoeca rosetta (strain ATCC 50818 / BSB-021) TaxID=946362 RepID=F2UII6_SALR5|nr:uncharacterized protein PTSG_07377 [Salpingoeca rosetta]EGD77035.1 hypothetical protein PTSG_07377 [Salpingoeca rosetta]|eukprot:XP_004990875.1 hypothetical protein PTSG_07377 [Salpingoeca rosetta]
MPAVVPQHKHQHQSQQHQQSMDPPVMFHRRQASLHKNRHTLQRHNQPNTAQQQPQHVFRSRQHIPAASDHSVELDKLRRELRILEKDLAEAQMKRSKANQLTEVRLEKRNAEGSAARAHEENARLRLQLSEQQAHAQQQLNERDVFIAQLRARITQLEQEAGEAIDYHDGGGGTGEEERECDEVDGYGVQQEEEQDEEQGQQLPSRQPQQQQQHVEDDGDGNAERIPEGSKEAWRLAVLKMRSVVVMLRTRLQDTRAELEKQRAKCAQCERRLGDELSAHMHEKDQLVAALNTERTRVERLSSMLLAFKDQSTRLQQELAQYQVGEIPEETQRLQIELESARKQLQALQTLYTPNLQLLGLSGMGMSASAEKLPVSPATATNMSTLYNGNPTSAQLVPASSTVSLHTTSRSAPAVTPPLRQMLAGSGPSRRPHSLYLPTTTSATEGNGGDGGGGGGGDVRMRAGGGAVTRSMALARANQRLREQVAHLQRQLSCADPKSPSTPV